VEGSGQKYGNSFRLRTQLIMAVKETHLWGESFQQKINDVEDIFNVQTQIGEIIIKDNEIEKIILRNKNIEIQRKEKKVVLSFEQWKLEDKTKVYEFMIEYARQKNLVLEK
jgi:hypothetical protein